MNDVQRLHYLLSREPEINRWRERTLHKLLVDAAPRIDALSRTFYEGCGFHYEMLNQLGNLIRGLSVAFQPHMNWVDKNWEEYQVWQVRKVVASGLFNDIRKAEKSAIKWKKENT
jgi:hypothetical protein